MKEKHKKILMFIVVVVVVALIISLTLKILSSLSWIAILIAAVIVYIYWPKIKKMLSF